MLDWAQNFWGPFKMSRDASYEKYSKSMKFYFLDLNLLSLRPLGSREKFQNIKILRFLKKIV